MKNDLYTVNEIAEICAVSRFTVNDWINKGLIKAFRAVEKGPWKIRKKDLVTFIEQRGFPLEFINDDKIRILVVDDEVDITTFISKALKREKKFEIEIANSGFKVGVKLKEFNPDILILDIILGDFDGRELLKHIKENTELNNIKVIGISGKIDSSEEQALLDMGFNSFIRKPFKINKIRDTILELIED